MRHRQCMIGLLVVMLATSALWTIYGELRHSPPVIRKGKSGVLMNDVAAANLLCGEGLPSGENMDVRTALEIMTAWTERVRAETERHFYRFRANPTEFENSEGYFRM